MDAERAERWHHRARPQRRGAGVALRSGRSVELVVLRTPGGPLRADRTAFDRADLIAIGRVVLDRGPPGLVDGWLDRSFAPSQAFNRSYGLLWWLNGQDSYMLPGPDAQFPGPVVPAAPTSMVAAWGKDDQKMYIVPEGRLVVARLGGRAVPSSQAAWSRFDVDLWERLNARRA